MMDPIERALVERTIGDPHWDAKPLEWRRKTRRAIMQHVTAVLDEEIQNAIDEFDPAQWEEGIPDAD